MATSRSVYFTAGLTVAGLVAGSGLALSGPALRFLGVVDQTSFLPGFGAPIVPFIGAPVMLASGWVMLALWHLGNTRWATAGVVSAFVGLIVAATTGFVPLSGMSVDLASALGVLEAMVAGVLLADQFGYLEANGLLVGLAADIWVLMGVLLMSSGSLLLTPILSVAMGAIVASPVLSVALLSHLQAGRADSGAARNAARATRGETRAEARRRGAWFFIAFLALPVCLGSSYLLVGFLVSA